MPRLADLYWQEDLIPSCLPSLSHLAPPSLNSMHGGGQPMERFKSDVIEGLKVRYYGEFRTKSWKNFLVRENDAYPV